MKKNAKAYLEITNLCNLSCSFCHGTRRAPRTMTEEEFLFLTERLRGRIKYLYFHLLGEPLLHPLLPRFIAHARAAGFTPMLTTNGTLLRARWEELLASLPEKISISLHAPAANAAFADAGYLDDCLAFAKEASARGCTVALRLWNLGGEGARENDAILARIRAAFPAPWTAVRGGAGERLSSRVFLEWGEEFDWPDLAAPRAEGPFFCYGLRDQIGILADGTVVPCCLDAEGTVALGNLHFSSLDEILSGERARAIYDGFSRREATEELCRRCGYARRFCKL